MSALILIADDMRLRLYNYNTMEKVKDMEAHADYIRFVEIHPTLPYILSSSDDMSIKLWNWEQNWDCTSSFEGHAHYVMMCKFNPKDTNTFASSSLDRTIKVPHRIETYTNGPLIRFGALALNSPISRSKAMTGVSTAWTTTRVVRSSVFHFN